MIGHCRTDQGDMVDHIAFRYYGRVNGTVEAILAANPVLMTHDPELPAGLELLLPEVPEPENQGVIRLWD